MTAFGHSIPTQWFAVRVRSRMAITTSAILANHGYISFLPMYHGRVLIPGYVLCRIPAEPAAPLLSIPGVIGIVMFCGVAALLDESEVSALQLVESTALPAEPYPWAKPGEPVVVQSGPLKGVVGTLVRNAGKGQLVISLEILSRAVAVEIAAEDVALMYEKKYA